MPCLSVCVFVLVRLCVHHRAIATRATHKHIENGHRSAAQWRSGASAFERASKPKRPAQLSVHSALSVWRCRCRRLHHHHHHQAAPIIIAFCSYRCVPVRSHNNNPNSSSNSATQHNRFCSYIYNIAPTRFSPDEVLSHSLMSLEITNLPLPLIKTTDHSIYNESRLFPDLSLRLNLFFALPIAAHDDAARGRVRQISEFFVRCVWHWHCSTRVGRPSRR